MTINSTTRKTGNLVGNGNTATYPFAFKVFTDADVVVKKLEVSTSIETTLTLGVNNDYIVTLSDDQNGNPGGSITLKSGGNDFNLPTGFELVITSAVQPLQGTDLTNQGGFFPEVINDALDKAVVLHQQQQEKLDRSISFSLTNTIGNLEITENANARKNRVLGFDNLGEFEVLRELGTYRGDWAASRNYAVRDLVKDTSTNNIFFCNTAHTSSGSQPLTTNANSANWDLIVDAESATISANNAAASATASANSATASANSATAAATSETNAASSASTATSKATQADTAKTAAETAQAAAETAQTAAETALDTFDDRYLGAKSSDPTLDNDGNALIDGALYFNTTDNVTKVYDLGNTVWVLLKLTSNDQAKVNTIEANISNVNAVGSNISNVNAVANNETNINAVNANKNNIDTVAAANANVNAVGGNISNVNAVAANASNINAVQSNETNINTVAGSNANVNTVANNIGNVNTVAADIAKVVKVADDLNETVSEIEVAAADLQETTSEIDTVANAIANVDTVGNNIANVNTVAGISTDVTDVANIKDDVTAVAGNNANVTAVKNNETNINTVATNISNVVAAGTNIVDINNFGDIYQISNNEPTQRADGSALQDGDLWYDSSNDNLLVYTGSSFSIITPSQSVLNDVAIVSGAITFAEDLGLITNAVTTGSSNGSLEIVADTLEDEITFVVTAATGKFIIDGVDKPALKLHKGWTYTFDVSDNSNSPHPLRFQSGGNPYSTNVTVTGTQGQAGAKVVIKIPESQPTSFQYYCTNHSGMGNNITVVEDPIKQVADVADDLDTLVQGNHLTNLSTVATSIANVNTVGSNISNVNSFANVYTISANAPSNPSGGDLWYDTSTNQLKNYNGSAWLAITASSGIQNVVDDATPQLGGALDGQNNNLTNIGTIDGVNLQLDFGTI